jgi:hypothetical protein
MKRIIEIDNNQGNLIIKYRENGRLYLVTLYAAGLDGEFTRSNWQESEELLMMFDQKDQELILNTLAKSSRTLFFRATN